MDGGSYRIEAERWLTIAEKLLTARDFQGAKTFAIRARDSDSRLLEFSEQIIAVADTLLAGELRIISYNGGGSHDYYAILQLPRLTQSMELVATQYRKLALLLNPTRNRLSFADHAFRLVSEAWMVFSNPSKKTMYDEELQMSQLGQLGIPASQEFSLGQPSSQGGSMGRTPRAVREDADVAQPESTRSTRLDVQSRMTEPIRPIAQHKVAEPIRPAPQPPEAAQQRGAEPFRPSGAQPVASQSQPSRPVAATPKVSSEPARPDAQPKSTEPSRPTSQASETEPSRSTRSSTQPNVTETHVPSFWTACPYCYILYEYPKGYEECAIRCQKCKRAFHAVMIPSPPVTGKNTYFCSWGVFPLGFSGKGGGGGFGTNWSPISALFSTPLPGADKSKQSNQSRRSEPKVIYKDDIYIDLSDPSEDESDSDDDDWDNRRKKVKSARGKATPSKNVKKTQNDRAKKVNVQNVDGGGGNVQGEVVGKGEGSSGRKRGAKDLGKLDLNVMFSNEVEEAVPGVSEGNGSGHGEEDNIVGTGFFEGLDEFLSSLPILSVVGDDKVKAS